MSGLVVEKTFTRKDGNQLHLRIDQATFSASMENMVLRILTRRGLPRSEAENTQFPMTLDYVRWASEQGLEIPQHQIRQDVDLILEQERNKVVEFASFLVAFLNDNNAAIIRGKAPVEPFSEAHIQQHTVDYSDRRMMGEYAPPKLYDLNELIKTDPIHRSYKRLFDFLLQDTDLYIEVTRFMTEYPVRLAQGMIETSADGFQSGRVDGTGNHQELAAGA